MKYLDSEGYAYESTVLVLLPEGVLKEAVVNAAKAASVKVCDLDVGMLTDLIAVPSFLSIIDPNLVKPRDWNELCGWYRELDDHEMKILLTGRSKHRKKIPSFNLLKRPSKINDDYIKFLIIRCHSVFLKKKKIYEKKERQIMRLLYIMCQLDKGKTVRLADIAKEFEVTKRTIERDITLLSAVGYPLLREKPGEVYFPKSFKSYQQYW